MADGARGVDAAADRHLANVLAAVAVSLSDSIRSAAETAVGHGAAAPAALVALKEFLGGGSMDDLRRVVGLSPSGAVRLVDRLEAAGYVERMPGADRRSVALALTGVGQVAADRVQAARMGEVETIISVLSDEERHLLVQVVDKLISAVTVRRLDARRFEQAPSGGWLCRLCDFGDCGRSAGLCPARTVAETFVPGEGGPGARSDP